MNPSGATTNQGCIVAFSRWCGVLMCLAFTVAGGAALWHGLDERQKNTAAQPWPVAEAKVLNARVKTIEPKTASKSGPQHRSTMYQVIIAYSYTVDGKIFSGIAPAPRQIADEEGASAAQAIADSFTAGSAITVYYRPERPAESRLSRVEVASSTWLWFAIGGGIAIPINLLGIWWLLTRFERTRPLAVVTTKAEA